MKYLVFVRGEDSDLRTSAVQQIMDTLNPDINTVRAIRVSMNDFGPFASRNQKRVALTNIKNMVRKIIGGSHQEDFIVVDNSNMNHNDWQSIFRIGDDLGETITGIGVDVRKNEHGANDGRKNEESSNVHIFKAMMYKYVWVENEQDIETVKDALLKLIN